MTYDDAEILLTRMSQAWGKRGAFGNEWLNVLEQLDHGRAGAAFIRLRDTEEHPPSIARFRMAYNAVRGNGPEPATCQHCDGTGMRPAAGGWQPESVPCNCHEGVRMAALVATRGRNPNPGITYTADERRTGLEALHRLGWAQDVPGEVLDELGLNLGRGD